MLTCALVLINSIVVLICTDTIVSVITGNYPNGVSVLQTESEAAAAAALSLMETCFCGAIKLFINEVAALIC